MEFWKVTLGLVRRPLIGPPVLLLSMGLAAIVYFMVPTRYASSTTLVLTTPPTGGTLSQDPSRPPGLSNPLLNFGEGLRTTATIIIQVMNTADAQASLGVVRDGPTKLVVDDGRTDPTMLGSNGPFVHIASESTSAAAAREVVSRAHEFVEQELIRRQQVLGAPQSTFVVAVEVTPPSEPKAITGPKVQASAVALVLGLVFGFGGTYLATTVLPAGSRRAAATPAVSATDAGLAEVDVANSPAGVLPKITEPVPARGSSPAAPVDAAVEQPPAAVDPARAPSASDLTMRDPGTNGAGRGRPSWPHPAQPAAAPTPAPHGPEA